jgi:hypothetical protein
MKLGFFLSVADIDSLTKIKTTVVEVFRNLLCENGDEITTEAGDDLEY